MSLAIASMRVLLACSSWPDGGPDEEEELGEAEGELNDLPTDVRVLT